MYQIIQNLKTGETALENLPVPNNSPGSLLIQTTHTLVSLGTERMLIDFSKGNIFEKARQQPEKVKQVLNKFKTDGVISTLGAVSDKLNQPLALGYCNVGKIIKIGEKVSGFSIGDRVVSNGPHAEVVSVPKNLVAKIPEGVIEKDAVFTVVGSIGLQGIRLIKPNFGETIGVIGLGLIGMITCQLLKANGCNVIGIDIDQNKCDILKKWGIDALNSQKANIQHNILSRTNNMGCDGVLITASSKSNDIISTATKICRKKGRIVLVGVIGLQLNRSDFYEKEISFQVSCSYGPGRYDDTYESKGIDYPFPYVRWTEKRNFEAILNSMEKGQLNFSDLITTEHPITNYDKIYKNINSENIIAAILTYPKNSIDINSKSKVAYPNIRFSPEEKPIVGVIGAGNFTKSFILPALKSTDAKVKYISCAKGLNSAHLAKKFNIPYSTTNFNDILKDHSVTSVIIATRHNLHKEMVMNSLMAKKNTFVEKPLVTTKQQLDSLRNLIFESKLRPQLMVGYNRRFSPHIRKIKEALGNAGPINLIVNMNAGFIEKNHWVHDLEIGGGRIIGEACHLIDVCVFLTGSLISSVCMNNLGFDADCETDNASLMLSFKDGSNAVINYFSNGSKKYSKERVEVYSNGQTWILDNYQKTIGFCTRRFKPIKTKINKGHKDQFIEYINCVKNGTGSLIRLDEIFNVSDATFAAIKSMKSKVWESI